MATPRKTAATTVAPAKAPAVKDQTSALYGKAAKRLRDAHRDEFEQYLTEAYTEAGLTRRVKNVGPTKAQLEAQKRAETKIADLLEKFGPGIVSGAVAVVRERHPELTAEAEDAQPVDGPVEIEPWDEQDENAEPVAEADVTSGAVAGF